MQDVFITCCLKFRYEVDKNPPENRKSSCTFAKLFQINGQSYNKTSERCLLSKPKKQGLEEFPEI